MCIMIDFQHTRINESKCSQLKLLLWHHITHCIDSDVQQRRKMIIRIPLSQGESGSQIKYVLAIQGNEVAFQEFRSIHTLDFARHTTYKNYLRHVKNSVSITLQEKLLQVSRAHNVRQSMYTEIILLTSWIHKS